MLRKPACLHIPALREDDTARIMWESVEEAQGYELDVHFDEDFKAASTGRRWSDVDMSGHDWSEINYSGLSWGEIESLPSQGLRWRNIEFHNRAWAEIDAQGLSWAQMQKLPVEFTIYRGPGEKTQGPGQGLSWVQLDAKKLGWSKIESKGKTLREFELLAMYGLMWGSLDARFLSWAEIESRNLTWREFETQPADSNIHIAHDVDIPLFKTKAIFRVRAFNDAGYSEYLMSSLMPIIPVLFREDSTRLSTEPGNSYLVQLHARGVEDFRDIVMSLGYDRNALRLDQFGFEELGTRIDRMGRAFESDVLEISREPGNVRFKATRQMQPGKDWNGLIVSALFTALRSGSTDVTLS